MPINFFDVCGICHAPEWTDSQIQLAKDLIKKALPDISVSFCEVDDIGIYIGSEELGRDAVYISHDYTDRNGRMIYRSANGVNDGKFFRDKENTDFVVRYTGKIFDGYSLSVYSSSGVTVRRTLEEIVNDAVVAFKTMQALEFEMNLKKDLDDLENK
jgi:hypothetical protein